MISLRKHIEIFKHNEKEGGLLKYLAELSPEEKIETSRLMRETYPMKSKPISQCKIKDDFNVTADVMDMVLGQFIMLEQIITGKMKYASEVDNDIAIAQLLLRPKHHKEFDNSDPREEQENLQKILDYDATEVYSVLHHYLDNRDKIVFKQFSGVFYEVSDDDPEEEGEEEVVEDRTSENLFNQQWYWYSIVRMLAKEDITRYEEIYMLKMSVVMPEMSYLAQKNKIEAAEQRKQQALSRL